MVPGNRNWRYRVVDIHVFVHGPSLLLPQLQEILEGRKADNLPGLTVRINIISFNLVTIMPPLPLSLDLLTSTRD